MRAICNCGEGVRGPLATRIARILLGSSLLVAMAGCGDAEIIATGPGGGLARVALSTSVASSGGGAEELILTARYPLIGGGSTVLATVRVPLSGTSQQVPITLDLAPCLRDATRAGSGTSTPATDECPVLIDLAFVIGGVTVDRQRIGPLVLRPGVTATVSDPVRLSAIGSVTLAAPRENVVSGSPILRLEMPQTMALTARILDTQQREVAGRSITWNSSAPAIATVSATGVVTPVSPGTVRIAAEVGGRDASVEVRVVAPPQVLTLVTSGTSGNGTVRSQPAGIDCTVAGARVTGSCRATFPADVEVVLTATPAGQTELAGWTADCSATPGAACTVPMSVSRTAGVTFRALHAVTITGAGTGSGSVEGTAGLACAMSQGSASGSCTATVAEGTRLTLTARPQGESSFRGWSGGCDVVNGTTCEIQATGARTVTARFERPVLVAVSGLGSGSGTVTSAPSGISCRQGSGLPGTCAAFFPEGTVVTLSAAASSGSIFRRWGGECASAVGTTCTVTAAGGDRSVTVQFDPPAILTVTPSGTGDGFIQGSSAINCTRSNGGNTGTCSAVLTGATVTLTAYPDAYSEFAGWTGACTGTGPCVVALDESRSVGAVFTRRQITVTLRLSGDGGGTVRLGTALTCTRTAAEPTITLCQTQVDVNRAYSVTATPGTNQLFTGFGEACAGATAVTPAGGSCTVTVLGATVVSASFSPANVTVSVAPGLSSTGAGTVSASSSAVTSLLACSMAGATSAPSGVCQAAVPVGTSVTLQATAAVGSTFATWGGACSASGASPVCVVSASTPRAVTATFTTVPSVTVTVTVSGAAGGVVTALGTGVNQSCSRSTPLMVSASATVCSWTIPMGVPFTVSIAGVSGAQGVFSGTSTDLCYASSSPCIVSGLTTNSALSVYLYQP
jgi:hypothetical protein